MQPSNGPQFAFTPIQSNNGQQMMFNTPQQGIGQQYGLHADVRINPNRSQQVAPPVMLGDNKSYYAAQPTQGIKIPVFESSSSEGIIVGDSPQQVAQQIT